MVISMQSFVEGVRNSGKGNEVLVLRCLKLAASDENMHEPWSDIQEPLVRFLERIVGLPEEVRSEEREVADLFCDLLKSSKNGSSVVGPGEHGSRGFGEMWKQAELAVFFNNLHNKIAGLNPMRRGETGRLQGRR